jgi:phage recombination protein Bet
MMEAENMTTAMMATPAQKQSLVTRFAEKYHIEPAKLLETLKATAFRQRGDTVVTNEQMAALLIVADQYKLNPFTKEIFAFNDKGAIVPVVSVDGWARIINEHPAFDGLEFEYSEEIVTIAGAKPCPAWCEVRIYRKDRARPTVVREYLDEVYQAPRGQNAYAGPWQSHTKRFLRHKALIQGARIAFGFAGIYDEDEANRIVDAQTARTMVDVTPATAQAAAPTGRPSRLHTIIQQNGAGAEAAQTAQAETVPVQNAGDQAGGPPWDGDNSQPGAAA